MPQLRAYSNEPFDSSTEIQLDDFFLDIAADTTTFTLTNKTNLDLGATVQADLVQYYYYNGGYTKTGSYGVVLDDAPVASSNVVFPGINPLLLIAYDQVNVFGNANSNVAQQYFYLGDHVDIATTGYTGTPANNNDLAVVFRDQIGYGALVSMVQLACATQDLPGTPTTFLATGETMYTPGFTAFSSFAASSAAASTTITVSSSADAASFIIGDYVTINFGTSSAEITKLLGVSGSTMTVSGLTYPHYIGETIYDSHRKFWSQVTVPVGFTSGTAQNYYNLSLYVVGKYYSRI